MEAQQKTLVVIAGGTIESGYNPEHGTPKDVPMPDTVDGTAIPELIEKLGRRDEVDILKLGMTDSKKMDLPTLDAALWHALEKGYDKVVIVQGTDTMPVHARYLKDRIAEWGEQRPELHDKTIILTGAMTPLRDKQWQWRPRELADGWDLVNRALDDARSQSSGVYVEMGEMANMPPGPWEAETVRKYVESDAQGMVQFSEFQPIPPAERRAKTAVERYADRNPDGMEYGRG